MERFPSSAAESGEDIIKEAAESAGLYEVETPRMGTKGYEKVVELAKKYIETIRMFDQMSTAEAEKINSRLNLNILDTEREKMHDQLCVKLEGKHKNELDPEERQKVANFAAYLVGAEEYVVRGNQFKSQASYFHDLGAD